MNVPNQSVSQIYGTLNTGSTETLNESDWSSQMLGDSKITLKPLLMDGCYLTGPSGPLWVLTIWNSLDLNRILDWMAGRQESVWWSGGPQSQGCFFSLSLFCLIIGFQSDWIIEGAAGPAEGHDRHDAVSSWRLTFWLLTGTQAAFLFARIFSF